MRSILAKHIVQRLSSKRVRQIEIRFPDPGYSKSRDQPARASSSGGPGGGGVVSWPARARLPARNGLVNEVEFLGLIPQNGERPMRLRDC